MPPTTYHLLGEPETTTINPKPKTPKTLGPESPTLLREDFRNSLAASVAVIFFDFDGTLTATPGDRAARRSKQLELCERAPMLAPRLKSLCADGASLGIISKSTETCREFCWEFVKAFCWLFVLLRSKPRQLFKATPNESLIATLKCFREYRGLIVVHVPG